MALENKPQPKPEPGIVGWIIQEGKATYYCSVESWAIEGDSWIWYISHPIYGKEKYNHKYGRLHDATPIKLPEVPPCQ